MISGEITYTGNEYRVPSPNFVCCCPMDDSTRMSICDDDSISSLVSTESTTFDVGQSQGKNLELELKVAHNEIMELKRQLTTALVANKNNTTNLNIGSNILTTQVSTLTEDEH